MKISIFRAFCFSHKASAPAYHHKTVLTPGQETLPYRSALAKLPFFSVEENGKTHIQKGTQSMPLTLNTRNNGLFRLGVSLCFEQWYPAHWAALSRNGADFYAHLAGEGWYGNVGFQSFMANVSRMRCIENRKQAARCANIGKTLFIDQMGGYTQSEGEKLEPINGKLYPLSIITFYAKNINWFPTTLALGLGIFSIIFIFTKKQNHEEVN